MNTFMFFSVLLWEIVKSAGLIVVAYLPYRIYKEFRLIGEILGKQAYG